MRDRAIDLLSEMVKIPSPSGEEGELAFFLQEEMGSLGYHVETDKAGNILGTLGDGHPATLLCSHLDTVPGQTPVKIEGDLLYGRGAVDAKGPLAAMITAAARFAENPFQGEVKVVGVVGEEGDGKGIKQLIAEKIKADHAIFGEPSGVGKIAIGYRGRMELHLLCETASGHGGSPWLFENAIDRAYDLWSRIRKTLKRWNKPRSYFNSPSSCLTQIEGGSYSNVVPGRCHLVADIRIPPGVNSGDMLKAIRTEVEAFKAERPKVKVKFHLSDLIGPYTVDPQLPVVRALASSILEVRGVEAQLVRKTGTGDMNLLGFETKIPTAAYGPGDPRLEHAPDEHIQISEYLAAIDVLERTLRRLHGKG